MTIIYKDGSVITLTFNHASIMESKQGTDFDLRDAVNEAIQLTKEHGKIVKVDPTTEEILMLCSVAKMETNSNSLKAGLTLVPSLSKEITDSANSKKIRALVKEIEYIKTDSIPSNSYRYVFKDGKDCVIYNSELKPSEQKQQDLDWLLKALKSTAFMKGKFDLLPLAPFLYPLEYLQLVISTESSVNELAEALGYKFGIPDVQDGYKACGKILIGIQGRNFLYDGTIKALTDGDLQDMCQ